MRGIMTTTTPPVATEPEVSRWSRLVQDWKSLAWPVVAALFAAMCHFAGYVAKRGKIAALGAYDLSSASVSQEYIIQGAMILADLGLRILIVGIILKGVWVLALRINRQLPHGIQARLRGLAERTGWGWAALAAAVIIIAAGLSVAGDLATDIDGVVLRPASKVGIAWMRMSLDSDHVWPGIYELSLVSVMVIFGALSRWIVAKFFKNVTARAVYGTWAVLQLFNLVTGYAFIDGAASTTISPYPIVAFSGSDQMLGKDSVSFLLGSDDREFAFLVIFKVGASNEISNVDQAILYRPRSEVKWITVIKQEPIHILARYHDVARYRELIKPPADAGTPDSQAIPGTTPKSPSEKP